jgi:hypothetical protein
MRTWGPEPLSRLLAGERLVAKDVARPVEPGVTKAIALNVIRDREWNLAHSLVRSTCSHWFVRVYRGADGAERPFGASLLRRRRPARSI